MSIFGVCGLPERSVRGIGSCGWPSNTITWYQNVTLTGLTTQQIEQAFVESFIAWKNVCNIVPVKGTLGKRINIEAKSEKIDGPYGILAMCGLPCGVPSMDYTMPLTVDNSDAWTYDRLKIVLTHEIGHGLGLDHLTNGNIMQPIYSDSIDKPQPGDISAIQAIYGPPSLPLQMNGRGWIDQQQVIFNGKLIEFSGDNLPPLPPKPLPLPGKTKFMSLRMMFAGKPYQFYGIIENA